MSATYPTKLLLAFRSGDRCAFPGCTKHLTVDAPNGGDAIVLGEAAHMAGEKPDAPRYIASMSDEQRDHYDNLIYLCGDHHTQIDKQHTHFPIPSLQRIKIDHESKVREGINLAFEQIGFPALKKATDWVARFQPGQVDQDLSVLPPEEKIQKNKLSNGNRVTIIMGLSVAKVVGDFIESEAQIDPEYPEKLKAGFLQEYYRLWQAGFKGDAVFDLMCEFAQRGMKSQTDRSAGLAVLVYLFEKCDVFEK
jgi:hypothetical protein